MGQGIVEGLDIFGQGILREKGKCVFVKGGLPGETVDYRVTFSKKKFAKGFAADVLKASPHRVEAPCPYYGICGGCSFQHCDEETELLAKENHVNNVLRRIGGFGDLSVLPMDRSRPLYRYRNKVTWHIKNGIIGFYRAGSAEFVPIEDCLLLAEPLCDATDALRRIAPRHAHTVMLRTNQKGEVFTAIDGEEPLGTAEDLMSQCSNIKGVEVNGSMIGVVPGMTLAGYDFDVSPRGFFQVNFAAMESLIDFVHESMLPPERNSVLLDLYCGVGTLGIVLSQDFSEVWGIESFADSIPAAECNALRNKINGHYTAAKTEDSLEKLLERLPIPHTVVVDPPRAGLDGRTAELLTQCGAKQLIYISCDPATLSRDLKILASTYQPRQIKPFNLFPRTAHVETIVLLQKETL